MLQQRPVLRLSVLLLLAGLISCAPRADGPADYLLRVRDENQEHCGYIDRKGDTVIATGKYLMCFTDTFRSYAIVLKENEGFAVIDREEKLLYQVFAIDNAPDEPAEGLFRIKRENRIGYADTRTGKIVIPPQFNCASPFEEGVAKVSMDCSTESDGEHSRWISDHWYYIDRSGNKVNKKE